MSTPRTKRMKQFERLNSASHWIKTYNGKSLVKGKREQQNKIAPYESDWYHAIIIGYTDGGASYGITWEQMEEINRAENRFVDPIDAPQWSGCNDSSQSIAL